MGKTLVKPEENIRCRSLNMEEGEIKCVKRRRRSPATAVLSCSSALQDNGQLQSQTSQVDHATSQTTPTTKVKRRTWNATQRKKGKQGAYGEEESAARAYDLAAIKYWGTSTTTNFPISDYSKEIEIMQHLTREEYLASLRRKSNGFARGASKYRGVARHHHNGRWEARIGRVFGNKYLYLGTQEEAARAYDIAAIEYRGINAMTNFEMSSYIRWMKPEFTNSPAIEGLSTNPHHQSIETVSNEGCYISGDYSISHKQELLETKLPLVSPCSKPSSPTALSLLLRSSMFKELKEKNPNAENEEIKGDHVTNCSNNWLANGYNFLGDKYDNVACVSPYTHEKLPKFESPRDILP
ncbi:hypothetical protein Leryth_027356, partial [Lithospermum erythrorhizon]